MRKTPVAGKMAPLVLMIDDSEHQLELYALVLQECYRVLLAGSGPKGIRMAQTERPDAIVCDLSMPGMDGWEVCRLLKAHPATAAIPILILTATSDSYLAQEAASAGVTAVLTKPCCFEKLRVSLDDAIDPLIDH